MSVVSKKLVPSSGTYLCSMQGKCMWGMDTRGDVSSMGKGCQAAKDI
jgi:hypothetical protein